MPDKIIPAPNVPPFVTFVTSTVPMVFDNSLSYYEALSALWKWLQDDVVNVINNNAAVTNDYIALTNEYIEKFNELKDYVDNYFENLDVQEEINNKLDAMVEDGTLQELINNYLQPNVTWTFDTVADMESSTNLVNGSFARTLGYFSRGDGGGATYKIVNVQPLTGHYETLDGGLYAELMLTSKMNLTQFGVDHTADDTTAAINEVISICAPKNIEIVIPAHTYNLKTLTNKDPNGYNYYYFLETLPNLKISGESREESILKIPNGTLSYTSVFFSDEDDVDNVSLKNFTIEQYYASGSDMNNRTNRKLAFVLYGVCKNIEIRGMNFNGCCGANTVAFHDNRISNVILAENIFDYHLVQGIAYYDRSVVYMECSNYVVEHNIVHGNMDCLGGVECHGFNGVCRENVIDGCYFGIHIAPRFSDSQIAANILVTGNTLADNARGIKLWNNTDPDSTLGCKGITITNNNITISGSMLNQYFVLDNGSTKASNVGGITTIVDSVSKLVDIIIDNNVITCPDYSDYKSYATGTAYAYSGISFIGQSDVFNCSITNNYIYGIAGPGITFGESRTSASDWHTKENMFIKNNTICNCGYAVQNVNDYKASIFIGYGNIKNAYIQGNIITKSDSSYTTAYAVCNLTSSGATKTNMYFNNNIVKSVIDDPTEFQIFSYGGRNIITDRGTTVARPVTANIGDEYYDTTLNKMIVYNGTAWINVDGTAL